MIGGRFWKLFLGSAIFVALTLIPIHNLLASAQERRVNEQLAQSLLTEACMVRDAAGEVWPNVGAGYLGGVTHTLRAKGVQLAVVAADGSVAEGWIEGAAVADLINLPEFARAIAAGYATLQRRWGPRDALTRVVAVRVERPNVVPGVVWLARPVWRLADHPDVRWRGIAQTFGIGALATIILAFVLLRVRLRLLRRIVDGVRRLSSGELSIPAEVSADAGLTPLVSALIDLRRRLALQVETIDDQRRTLEALVEQLHEGVIVVGPDARVLLVNPAAARLLNLAVAAESLHTLTGRSLESCIPQLAVQQLLLDRPVREFPPTGRVEDTTDLAAHDPQATQLMVKTAGNETHILARASDVRLGDADQGNRGRVVVLTDVTALQHTIQVRTDFVANASHELRTPLSTIRAACETVLAMDLNQEAEMARRFIAKIDKHSVRLERMVADLLDLSRLESSAKRFEFEEIRIRPLLEEIRARFADLVERKDVVFEIDCDPLRVPKIVANAHLLRLIVDNLLDNAIKFTEPGKRVVLRLDRDAQCVKLAVRDEGCGIAPEEQRRVFERFYQVQRERSGVERGTGLGLAIVRHAVGALQGTVHLESTPDVGTTVRVELPQTRLEPRE